MSFTDEEREAIGRYIDHLGRHMEYQTALLEHILAAQLPRDEFKKTREDIQSRVWPSEDKESA